MSSQLYSLLFVAHNGGVLAPACVKELDTAITSETYGRVAAIAEMLVILKGDDVMAEIGALMNSHVYQVIGREIAAKALNELAGS